jgi:ADP-ribosylglycohydrolase
MLPSKDQFSGCLVGQCLGDALGFVAEGFSPAASKRYVEDYLKTDRVGEFGRFPFQFGQYSDDSQLARELIQSYVAKKKFDPADYAEHIKNIFAEKRIVGFGYSTKEAAKRLFQGVSWEESGTPPPAAGNGSAMRAAPIGLFFFDNPRLLVSSACDQGRITHKDPRSSAGAVAISGAVALALQGKNISAESFLSVLAEWADGVDPGFSSQLRNLISWVSFPPEEAFTFIEKAGADKEYADDDEWKGISAFVVSSVLWSLYSFLRTPHDYWETICTAIEVGGDVDTTAAMAGAVSGAFLGIGAVPAHMAERLNDRGTWKSEELIALAHLCHEIKFGQNVQAPSVIS